jgi:hypothetical protein
MDTDVFSRGVVGTPKVLLENPHRVVMADPPDACRLTDSANFDGAIVLANRGHCTFVQKTRTIQKAGGVGLLVINSEDRVQVMTGLQGSTPEVRGLDIHIPSFLLTKEDGLRIAALAEMDNVTLTITPMTGTSPTSWNA